MENILSRIERNLNFKRPISAFAVVENGPDAFDYVVRVHFAAKGESLEAGKYRADVHCHRLNSEACLFAPETSYCVVDVTADLARYYWEKGEPMPC